MKLGETKAGSGATLKLPSGVRILIVGEDDATTQRLKAVFQDAGFISETAKSVTAACESAKSGRFQAVVSTPVLTDGSWRGIVGIAKRYDLGFEVVLVARDFDLLEWSEALRDGAFDVIDAASDLPKGSETIRRALWAAYLKGAGPAAKATSPPKAA